MSEHEIMRNEILAAFASFLPCGDTMLREEDFLSALPDEYRAPARELLETSAFEHIDGCLCISNTSPMQTVSWNCARQFFCSTLRLFKDALPDDPSDLTNVEKLRALQELADMGAVELPNHSAVHTAQAFLSGEHEDGVDEISSQAEDHIDMLGMLLTEHRIMKDYACKWLPLMCVLEGMLNHICDIPLSEQADAYMVLSYFSILANEDMRAIKFAYENYRIVRENPVGFPTFSRALDFLTDTLARVFVAAKEDRTDTTVA